MWFAILIAAAVCAFALLSTLSNERYSRLQQIEHELQAEAEKARQEAAQQEEPIVVS